MPTPADLRKQFISAFNRLADHRERHDVLADFLEMAFCTIRKTTLPPGPAADAIEERYMAVVKRNKLEDVRAMPKLLGIAAQAIEGGGCDFLGEVVVELELRSDHSRPPRRCTSPVGFLGSDLTGTWRRTGTVEIRCRRISGPESTTRCVENRVTIGGLDDGGKDQDEAEKRAGER